MKGKQFGLGLLLALALILGGGVIHAQDMIDRDAVGGRLIVNDATADNNIDPFVNSWHVIPSYAVFATLFQKAENLEFVGYLADTWEASEDPPSLTINLIDYATFSDGTPVNAEAIKWNLDKHKDPEGTSTIGGFLKNWVVDIEVLDEYTLRLNLSGTYASLVSDLSAIEIVSPTAYEMAGPDDFGQNPIGAGPFIFKEWVSGSHYLFERREDMNWLPEEIYENTGPVYLEELEVRFVKDEQTVLAGLETGEFHFASVPTQNLQEMVDNEDVIVQQQLATGINYVGFNTSKAPWDNAALRRAFSYAINRVDYDILVYDDLAEPLYQPLPPTIWGHNPELDDESPHYDPERAMAELDELGYVDADGDGWRDTPEGEPWAVPLNATSAPTQTRGAQVIEAMLREVGIPAEVGIMEQQSLIDLTTTGTHDLFLLWYGWTDPNIMTYFFDPGFVGASNRAHYVNSELADLLVAANGDLNQERRYETIQKSNRLIIENAPWIFLVTPPNILGVHASLQNWKIHPEGNLLYWNAYFTSDN